MFGKVARCKTGKLGVIWAVRQGTYIGIGFDGTPWESKEPEIIADSILEYYTVEQTGNKNDNRQGY